jgi:hypothetical protein
MTTYEIITLVFSGALMLLTALGLGGVWLQLRQARLSQRADFDRTRRQATLDFYGNTLALRTEWRNDLPYDFDKDAVAESLPDPQSDDEDTSTLTAYLDHLESLATAVKLQIYDLATVNQLAGPRLLRVVAFHRAWISARRKYADSPTLYRDLEWMAQEIEEIRQRESDPR